MTPDTRLAPMQCATTSLAAWLGQHPQAVAPTPKV